MAWIIIHLGRNPINGGSPPRLIIDVIYVIFSTRDKFIELIWLMNIILYFLNVIQIVAVMILYMTKYIIQLFRVFIVIIIHARWLIDEYAIILRSDVWLIPPIAPIAVDIITVIINTFSWGLMFIIIDSGAIFCQVINKMHLFQSILDMISGTHMWNGAAPSFTSRDIKVIVIIISLFSQRNLIMMENIRIDLLTLCTKKYIIAASAVALFAFFLIRGINAIILISNPIHILIQLLENIVINGPKIVMTKNTVLVLWM